MYICKHKPTPNVNVLDIQAKKGIGQMGGAINDFDIINSATVEYLFL